MGDWLSFKAVIDKVGVNPCVAVPKSISQTFNQRAYIPVELDLLGSKYVANLVPVGHGNYRLYLNGLMLKSTGWQVGEKAEIKLRYDPEPRIEPVPPALLKAFKSHPKAEATFSAATASRRKEISRYINNLKSAVAVERNVKKVIAALEGKDTHITVR